MWRTNGEKEVISHSKDHFVNIVTNQRWYSWLLVLPDQFFVCTFMNSICTYFDCWHFLFLFFLLLFLISGKHWMCWHCFTSHTVWLLSDGRRHMLWRPDVCQNVSIDTEKTMIKNVFMGQYSMIYYLSNTVCVFYFPRSWWGWLAGVFIKCLNLYNVNMKLYFYFVVVVDLYSPQSVFGCFHCTALLCVSMRHALQAFSWYTTNLGPCFWKRLGLKYHQKPYLCDFN